MKRITFVLAAVIAAFGIYSFQQGATETLAIGDAAPKTTHKMRDITGEYMMLKDAAMENGLLVVFSCNTCPFVIGSDGSEGWEGRYSA